MLIETFYNYKYPTYNRIFLPKTETLEQGEEILNERITTFVKRGYKVLNINDFNDVDLDTIRELFKKESTNIIFPMKYKCQSTINNNEVYYTIPKMYGIQVCIRSTGNNIIIYDLKRSYSIPKIIESTYLKSIFEKYPSLIFEGYLYMDFLTRDSVEFLYHKGLLDNIKLCIVDIADELLYINKRNDLLCSLNISNTDPNVNFLVYTETKDYDYILSLYNTHLINGYDGILLKSLYYTYRSNGTSNACLSLTLHKSTLYEIINYINNIITIKLHNGVEFEIPIKIHKFNKFLLKYKDFIIGQKLEVKYSYLTNNIPQFFFTNKIHINNELFSK